MKKTWVLLLIFLVLPFVSANIIVNQQPDQIYNLGDIVKIPVSVKSASAISGSFNMDLVCGPDFVNFYKNPIVLSADQEKKIEASLILMKEIIGDSKGACRVRAFIGSESVLTSDFTISDSIMITPTFQKIEFNPGESIIVKGKAIKENGKDANGFVELLVILGNESKISQQGTINSGIFTVNATLPKDMKAGSYLVQINAREEDISKEITNLGVASQNIAVRQVPTSLEIVFENHEIEPGTDIRVKAVLHDQTGEKIEALVFLSVKNRNSKIIEQTEVNTDEFFEYPISYDEAPSVWKVVAVSSKLSSEASFSIIAKEDAKIEITNKTVTITNTGNVPYNKSVSIKIGNESLGISVYLKVGQSQRYILTAPDGRYDIEVLTPGSSISADNIFLTGSVIDAEKVGGKIGSVLNKNSLAWIFIILVLAFFSFIIFKRVYKKSFFGYIGSKLARKENFVPLSKNSLVSTKNRAEVSLSIKGEKQDVSLVALHVKNLNEIQGKEGNAQELIQKIVEMAEDEKAVVYESQDMVFFIFAPAKTKTFKNEKTALDFSQKVNSAFLQHNKMFKQTINFGISLNYGTIVAKQDLNTNTFKFMALGTLMTASKKIASIASNEVLLGERMNDRIRSEAKTEKHHKSGITVFALKEMRNKEDHSEFIHKFLDRLGK